MADDTAALFAAHQRRLFKYFCRAVGETETARDLTQDVFVRVSRTAIPAASDGEVRAPLSVRGVPNRPFRFYFDSIVDGSVTLDIYGILVSRLETGALAISVETRSRWAPGSPNFSGPRRSVRSEIQVKPAETVEIRLQMLGDDAGPLASRSGRSPRAPATTRRRRSPAAAYSSAPTTTASTGSISPAARLSGNTKPPRP